MYSTSNASSLVDIGFGIRVAGIARVAVGVALILARVIGGLSGFLRGLAGLESLHLAGDGVWFAVSGIFPKRKKSQVTYLHPAR